MAGLRHGDVAVHTTELDLTSNDRKIDTRPTVIFRTTDLERMIYELMARDHVVEPLDLAVRSAAKDRHIGLTQPGHHHQLRRGGGLRRRRQVFGGGVA